MTPISFTVPWLVAFLGFAAVLHGANAHKRFERRFGSPAHLQSRDDTLPPGQDPPGGGGSTGGSLTCTQDYENVLVLTVIDGKDMINVGIDDSGNVIASDAKGNPLTDELTADHSVCGSTFMGYTETGGHIEISGTCLTVTFPDPSTQSDGSTSSDPIIGTVTVGECLLTDDQTQTTQYFVANQDNGGPYLQFVGAPETETALEVTFGVAADDTGVYYVYASIPSSDTTSTKRDKKGKDGKNDDTGGGTGGGSGETNLYQFAFTDSASGSGSGGQKKRNAAPIATRSLSKRFKSGTRTRGRPH